MEIERRWLINSMPNINPDIHCYNEQFYLSTTPEVRLRKIVDLKSEQKDYRLTVKSDGGLVREEFETEISREFYEGSEGLIDKPVIKKDYYVYSIDGYNIEVSIVDDGIFIYSEVEFASEKEARAYIFPWPTIVIKEVTDQQEFNMKNYWKNGSIPLNV